MQEKKNAAIEDTIGDRARQKELDDFWNVENLLPGSRPSRIVVRPAQTPPSAVEVELDQRPPAAEDTVAAVPLTVRREDYPSARPDQPLRTAPKDNPNPYGASSAPRGDRPLSVDRGTPHFVPPHTADEAQMDSPCLEYVPDGVLLHKVSVYEWRSNFHYFDEFAHDAVRYAARKPSDKSARRESFFSFLPQYAQLTQGQTAWYLRWREAVRGGEYPDTDYAYILLYLFELINLPADDAEAAAARDRMADVWIAYRKRYPQLDHYMCEWLCDYCLIHRLNAPVDRLMPALGDIIEMSRLKEFYLTAAVTGDSHDLESARILLRHCCQYDYHKSKFAQGEQAPMFDKLVPGAVAAILPLLLGRNGQAPLITMQDSSVTRDAYTGALCAYRNKRRITVSYTSFSRSHEFRFLIGDVVKHVENRIRGWIGVRSRLSILTLPVPVRDAVDVYLRPFAPAQPLSAPKKDEPAPAYEKLYDLPRKQVTLADADAIERSSWDTTRILTDAFGAEDSVPEDVPVPAADPVPDVETLPREPLPAEQGTLPDAPASVSLADALGELCTFVRMALNEDGPGQRAFAVSRRTMPDAVAEEINAITADGEVGDVILDDRGDGVYTVLEDYRELVRQALKV